MRATQFILILFFLSCKQGYHLENNEWILWRYASSDSTHFFTRSEKRLALYFTVDGIVRVSEFNGEKYGTTRYSIEQDDYLKIKSVPYKYTLSNDNLILNRSTEGSYEVLTFKIAEKFNWSDSVLLKMNEDIKKH